MEDANDIEVTDEWHWRNMLEDDGKDYDEYCTISDDVELVAQLLYTFELITLITVIITLDTSYMPIIVLYKWTAITQ